MHRLSDDTMQNVHMSVPHPSDADAWPTPSPEVRDLIRRGAEVALNPPVEWVAEMHEASLGGVRMSAVADDPTLADATRRANLANMLHWASSNVQFPGRRVPVNLGAETLASARDMVRRGLDESALDAYRTAQSVAWRYWMAICFELTDNPPLLRELLDITSRSIATFIDDTVDEMTTRMRAERADLTRGSHAERRETVALLVEGAPISAARAENQLGYGLSGPHTAAVIWDDTAHATAREIESVAEEMTRIAGVRARLTIIASAASLWVWLPTREIPALRPPSAPGMRIALGRPGTGVDGFRRSHLQALASQRLVARLASPQQVVRYDDIRLVSLITSDPAAADEFLTDTLGDLVSADADTLDTLYTWIAEQCNTSRTAERLYTHRNTVIRRLARADELLPRPVADNLIDVAAALEVLHWRTRDAR